MDNSKIESRYLKFFNDFRAAIRCMKATFFFFFFLSGFSFTDTDDSQDSRGRERTIFIPLYHFHPLTNIQIFICNFACEMTITYF